MNQTLALATVSFSGYFPPSCFYSTLVDTNNWNNAFVNFRSRHRCFALASVSGTGRARKRAELIVAGWLPRCLLPLLHLVGIVFDWYG